MALTTAFVTAVRRQGSIPSSFTSSDILAMGDGEIQAVFVPLLERLRQNFLVRELTASPDSRGRVALPARAVGAALRSVHLQVGNGWTLLPQKAIEENDFASSGQPFGYYLDAGSVALLPSGTSGTLKLRYSARPGRMVLDTATASAGVISGVTVGSTTTLITSTYSGVGPVDVVSAGPAHQQKVIGSVLGPITNTDCLETPAVGDYLCDADTSPFVPLPEELVAALVHRTSGVILRALGYDEEAGIQLALAGEAIANATPMLVPRNEGNPQRFKGGLRASLRQARVRVR